MVGNSKKQFANFKRTKFENKTEKVARELLIKHYNNIGRKIPKYITEGHLTSSDIKKAKNTITNGYNKKIDKEYKVIDEYNKAKKVYNQRIRRINKKVLEGKSWIEQQYLKGEHIYIPSLSYKGEGFTPNQLTLEKEEGIIFSTLDGMKERTRQLRENLKRLKNPLDDRNWYNVDGNKHIMENAIERLQELGYRSNSIEVNNMVKIYNSMTPIQQEISVKLSLAGIIEKYLKRDIKELDEESSQHFFSRMHEYMNRTKRVINSSLNSENINNRYT